MRHLLIATVAACAVSSVAVAQDLPKAEPGAEHPPTATMDKATPTMKAPEGEQQAAPTNRVGEAVPPMKATDPKAADTVTKTGAFVPDQQWVGRYVYSSDDKELGKIASVKQNGSSPSELFFDMGGFLGIGATRRSVTSDQIQDVKNDRIVLRLTQAEAKNLPAADDTSPAQK
jgi:hypothetical protein